jgi:hypothetical protein
LDGVGGFTVGVAGAGVNAGAGADICGVLPNNDGERAGGVDADAGEGLLKNESGVLEDAGCAGG